MSKLTQLAVVVGSLLAGFGVFYHFVIFLPGVEARKAMAVEQTTERKKQAYASCMTGAELVYEANWASACKDVARDLKEKYDDCLNDQTVMSNPYLGKRHCKQAYGGADPARNCSLPSSRADTINGYHKQAQEACMNEAKLGLQ